MSRSNNHRIFQHCLFAVLLTGAGSLYAQQDRIVVPIDSRERLALSGNVSPRALPQFDRGPVDPSMKLNYVTLILKPSAGQQAALEKLLADQQDRTSANYHKWLTPEQYADRFGLSPGDIGKVRVWLESQGFTVNYAARGRNWLAFSGTAEQVTKAFQTEIHQYALNEELHFANPKEPAIPVALQQEVLGIIGLDDFRGKPKPVHFRKLAAANSNEVSLNPHNISSTGFDSLAPADIATIYNITPIYQAGHDGSGQRIVIVGGSDIDLADIQAFRQNFGLPANIPEVILYGPDPGIPSLDALTEADLDIEWAGGVAPGATIVYVYATDTFFGAVPYAVDNVIAPIISTSYDQCEPSLSTNTLNTGRAIAQQASAEGISWLAASGDSGSAACDKQGTGLEAVEGVAVDHPADVPEVTAVGGTAFNEQGGNYWSSVNGPNLGSALSYIPEIAWNDSGSAGLAASGGGMSMFYPKPPWQAGLGVPNDGARDLPDVALSASGDHDPYWIYTDGQWQIVGGTSAATPVFAGIVALLNQYEGSHGQGNINPNLYRLAQVTTDVFHDITSGSNVVPCELGTPNCTTGFFGYNAGPGYDLVTGLGSVDAYNLVTEWNAATPQSNVVPSCTPDPVYEGQTNSQGYSWFYTIGLTETAGVGTTLTGFTINGTDYSSQLGSFFNSSAITANGDISANIEAKTLTVPTTQTFGFTGVDASGRQWSKQLSVSFYGPQSSTQTPVVSSVVNAASYQAGMSPGAVGTLFGQNLSPVNGIEFPGGVTSYKGVTVTVQGNAAPLFVVANVNGQEQINFQVPMGLSSGTAQVEVNNNGAVGAVSGVSVSTLQPGIFEYVPTRSSVSYAAVLKPDGSAVGPFNPASRGTTVAMFMTGLGPTSPPLSTGQLGPVPAATTNYVPRVGINGVDVPVVFSGVAPGFIGLDQVNFLIPANATPGSNLPLTVSANGVASQTSRIAVQ
jgi:uncharacterized protein (TIGR03437 family)